MRRDEESKFLIRRMDICNNDNMEMMMMKNLLMVNVEVDGYIHISKVRVVYILYLGKKMFNGTSSSLR